MAKVKICGLTDPDMVGLAAREGADWIGFVFAESPRRVTLAAASSLLLQVRQATPVALLVDPDDVLVDEVCAIGFPILQLHGQETPARVSEIKARTRRQIWKAIGVKTSGNLALTRDYTDADGYLIDAPAPEGSGQAGGHGNAFDWTLLKDWAFDKPWLLAGGLNPDNVAAAITQTGAPAVDVSSGVERRKGLKDAEKVRAFIRAAKSV